MKNETATLLPCPFCGEALTINNAHLGAHPRFSECIYAQQVVVADDAAQVAKWNTRAALADPVPPAVETVQGHHPSCQAVDEYKPGECSHGCHGSGVLPGLTVKVTKCSYCGNGWKTIAQAEAELRLEDQAHVTRLQAEVEHWRNRSARWKERVAELTNEGNSLNEELVRRAGAIGSLAGERSALQSELAKARDALTEARYNECLSCADDAEALGADAVAAYLRGWAERKRPDSHQSSPAAKDEPNDCAHSEANKHGCPECGEEFKP